MSTNLTLLQLNDLHGYLAPHPELIWTPDGPEFPRLGGLARIKTLFDRVRKECPGSVLAFDNGDTFHGTHAAVSTKGEALLPPMNALGLNAMTAHWEFAWGPKHVEQLAQRLDHPLLAANCYRMSDDSRPFPAAVICEAAGLRIGVIGLAATIIDKTMPPHFSEGVRFTDGPEEVREEATRLRAEGADLILVLSHLGLPQDLKLAQDAPDIDILLSAHTHNRLMVPVTVGKTLVIQSGCHGSFIGRLDLTVKDGRVIDSRHALIPVDDTLEEDPEMAALVDQALQVSADLDRIVGETPMALHRATCLDAPMDDLLLAAVARAAGTDIAFSNGWRYGAPVPPGPVTAEHLWNIVPADPPVSTVELTGAEILQMMEENIERTFSCDPFGQRGGYVKRFRGLTFRVKLENPKGLRIQGASCGDAPLEPGQTYKVGFITAQGVPPQLGKGRRDLNITAIAALEKWFSDPGWTNGGLMNVGRLILV
ncbi:2',3'-cyclic-nucleotide 2'-phosphodiesterase/5'-or 3'-nucleotidase, 5'-nucleotidase family [Paracoccus solventivorans]|uniref:2',3'-cyclic-nucleotide 2'-phosphodiesterase/5'-or 3'-nucleotidase, 5'-nucleotidase family n=1 Tax=Paracoccus solventivorans TaxID=53463 RepID=A0A1M7K6J1_9RHOB|nr:5'-nucleotidase C-terminal domain-containing protein [Paracoccus solventivorans]SHM60910.1 2',3'-cyclic-nucleotide 2'-phosphodiesterase/5'-or 3'-nucleotidase, 5'-nucleotidase family [Paracoccus solventivorans]